MSTYNIKKEREEKIYKAINKMIDEYLDGRMSGLKSAHRVLTKSEYEEYFSGGKKNLKDLKKDFSKPKVIEDVISNIKSLNNHLFKTDEEYKSIIKKILDEVIKDRIAKAKDKPKNENNTMEVLKFDKFFENYTNIEKNVKLYEIKLPILKLEEILTDIVGTYNDKTYKSILTNYYKIYDEYIDCIDKKKHLYRVNDMSGDVMNSNRVFFDAIIFDKNDLNGIKTNVVDMACNEFNISLPSTINVFGIEMKPSSFLNKDEVKYTVEQNITNEMIVNIIASVSQLKYEGKYQDFYIWSNKK